MQGFFAASFRRRVHAQLRDGRLAAAEFSDRFGQRADVDGMDARAVHHDGSLHGCAEGQIGNLPDIGEVRGQVIMRGRA